MILDKKLPSTVLSPADKLFQLQKIVILRDFMLLYNGEFIKINVTTFSHTKAIPKVLLIVYL